MSTGEKDERGLGGIGFPDRPSLGMWREKTQSLVVGRGDDQDSLQGDSWNTSRKNTDKVRRQ